MPYSLHRDTILIGTVGGEFSFYYLYRITVWSAAPQTTLWGGPHRAEIRTWDGRSRGTDTQLLLTWFLPYFMTAAFMISSSVLRQTPPLIITRGILAS